MGFFRGLAYPFKGLGFVFRHGELVRFWIFPIVITVLVLGLVMKGVWDYHDPLFEALWTEPTGEGFWDGVARFFHGFAEVIFAVALLVVGLVVVILVSNLVAAPFNDLLSEEVERLATGRKGPPFSVKVALLDLGRTLVFEGLYLAVGIVSTVASWLLPVVGQIALTAVMWVVTAQYWAISYIDWPCSRRRKGLGYRFTFAARHFGAMTGFGTGAFFILFVPLLNLFFMPAVVAGGTLLFLDLEAIESTAPTGRP